MPALDVPYFSTSTPDTWFGASPTAVIPVQGWSTAAVSDWAVTAYVLGNTAALRPTVTVAGPDSVLVNGAFVHTINNGRTLTVTVSFPAGAQPGTWAVIGLRSARLDNSTIPPPGADASHHWFIGVWWPFGR